jgi:hypothetical protein
MSARTLTFAAFAAAALLGCGSSSNSINPVPVTGADASVDAADAATDQNVPDQEAGAVVRKITVRDPFGNLEPGNMVYDGDFEFTSVETMQPAWSGLSGDSVKTGAVCRSGMRCVEVTPVDQARRRISGWFVWPDAPSAEVSFYAAIAGTDCANEVSGSIIDATFQKRFPIVTETANPVDGWCHFRTVVEVDTSFTWYQIMLSAKKTTATGPVIFDQVSIRGTDEPPTVVDAGVPEGGFPEGGLPEAGTRAAWITGDAELTEARETIGKLLPPNPPHEPRPVKNPTGRRLPGH